jgi:hypothetical protein
LFFFFDENEKHQEKKSSDWKFSSSGREPAQQERRLSKSSEFPMLNKHWLNIHIFYM